MENIHKSASRPWISDRINVKEFRDDWFATSPCLKSTKEVFQLKDKEFAEIEAECGLDAMKCLSQLDVKVYKNIVMPINSGLKTLGVQKEDLEKRENNPDYDALVKESRKVYSCPPAEMNYYSEEHTGVPFEEVVKPEVVLSIQIFRPEKKVAVFQRSTTQRNPGFNIDQEFMVLGSQFLTELRDKIICISDEAIPGDYSEHPNMSVEVRCKDLYKSGFFYIDGVFYNDLRHKDCRDYSSKTIIKWAASREDRGIGPFQKATMERTQFIDLNIQLGYPYVYVHQGNCEHLIVFSDLLMHSSHHSNNRNEYPRHAVLKQKKRTLCMVCQKHAVEWIVHDNKLLPQNPFFFCKQCFFSFNYDENNKKIGDFRAYHRIDRSTIM
ncbi:hypothetical protein JTE90_019139 [Oedothorax gibbosus]|uniref:snRNA-activating protein complex subunit 3 n=1 Tax=Oedothorax gibbosus TaxID=931172 RepID=A0AAV6U4I9_9ARAC|nr:hypothetical protein JTE90_019139 [Oedothorax gibbosus]